MKFQIKDFVDGNPVEVEALDYKGSGLVLITQRAGAMSFQHAMRAEQARFMAAAIAMAADEAEKMQPAGTIIEEAQP